MREIDLRSWPRHRKLTWIRTLDEPDQILIEDVRVSEPVRVIDTNGTVLAIDWAGTEPVMVPVTVYKGQKLDRSDGDGGQLLAILDDRLVGPETPIKGVSSSLPPHPYTWHEDRSRGRVSCCEFSVDDPIHQNLGKS